MALAWARLRLGLARATLAWLGLAWAWAWVWPERGLASILHNMTSYLARRSTHSGVELGLEAFGVKSGSRLWGLAYATAR